MSFWSKLGKGLAIGGSIAGAPFTGGGSLAALGPMLASGGEILSNVGRASGDAAGSVMDARFREDLLRQGYDRNRLDRGQLQIGQTQARDRTALDRAALMERMGIDRAKLGIEAPQERARQAAWGDALQNVQDVKIDFTPVPGSGPLPKFNVSGGLRPSMFGPNARAAGGELSRQALMALMNKSDIPERVDVPDVSPLVDLPEMLEPRGSSALEKTLGVTGLAGNILGGIGTVLKGLKKQTQAPAAYTNPALMRKVQF